MSCPLAPLKMGMRLQTYSLTHSLTLTHSLAQSHAQVKLHTSSFNEIGEAELKYCNIRKQKCIIIMVIIM